MSLTTPATPGLMNIGEEARPRFAVLPDAKSLFVRRAKRLAALSKDAHAKSQSIDGYLAFVARVCAAQNSILAHLPDAKLPAIGDADGTLPLRFDRVDVDDVAEATFLALLNALIDVETGPQLAQVQALKAQSAETRRLLLSEVLRNPDDIENVGDSVLALAALQVHFTRLAGKLDAEALKPVADGVCPVCASPPVASSLVSWPEANNTRFCMCSLCATQWHVVRLKCVTCSSTAGVSYPHIEGHTESLRAETCDICKSYVKIVYQVKDPALDPFADDIGSLDLDFVLREEGWKRGGRNPFLLGY